MTVLTIVCSVPTKPVTRGQMAALLYRHVEADYQGQASTYEDIDPAPTMPPGVAWLTDFAVVPGCESNLFCPSHNATRAEAALFIHGVAIRPHMWGAANTDFIPNPNNRTASRPIPPAIAGRRATCP